MELFSTFRIKYLLFALALGAIIYLGYRLVHLIVVRVVKQERLQNRLLLQLPLMERITWPVYGVILFLALVVPNPIWGTFVAVLLIASSWSYIKNYFAGIYFVLSGEYKNGQHVKVGSYQGKISHFKNVRCQFELDNGEVLSLPYTFMVKEAIIKTSPSEKIINDMFPFTLQKPCNLLAEKERLHQLLIAQPWLIPGSRPVIEVVEETDVFYRMHISIQIINKEHLQLVRKSILN